MALDGVFLSLLKNEINARLEGARVDKVQQPEKDEIDLVFRKKGGAEKLLVSASANNPRVHFTERIKENPVSAPMFCMFLRKHLTSARFAGARQHGLERILFLDFLCFDEFGDETKRTLAVEIMGRHSNIILFGENGVIMDSIKHIDETMSSRREVLPGLKYTLPPPQDKLGLLDADAGQIVDRIVSGKDAALPSAFLSAVQGVSPIVCRELSLLSCRSLDVRSSALDERQKGRLRFFIEKTASDVQNDREKPVMVVDPTTKKPLDFAFMGITQYGGAALTKEFSSCSALLDSFYLERDRIERFNQRAQDILKLISNLTERVSRKLENQRLELKKCGDRERLRVCGDLLSANIYQLKKGDVSCTLDNFYDENGGKIDIALDPMLTPSQNLQKYYKAYRKACTAENFLKEQIASDLSELAYFESVFEELSRASGESGLSEIRAELTAGGYIRAKRGQKPARVRETGPQTYRTPEGFEIYSGRNNRQNDRLTLKIAAKNDIWLHTRNIPGSHVIISLSGNSDAPEPVLLAAAKIAALHSKAKDSANVPVDYTRVKNVKKPSGAKPGMVIYESFKTLFVTPDPALEEWQV